MVIWLFCSFVPDEKGGERSTKTPKKALVRQSCPFHVAVSLQQWLQVML